jgi:hypothetical protein
MVSQLCSLERRTIRGGRDSVDHLVAGHDDLANAVAGCLLRVASVTCAWGWLQYYKEKTEAWLAKRRAAEVRLSGGGAAAVPEMAMAGALSGLPEAGGVLSPSLAEDLLALKARMNEATGDMVIRGEGGGKYADVWGLPTPQSDVPRARDPLASVLPVEQLVVEAGLVKLLAPRPGGGHYLSGVNGSCFRGSAGPDGILWAGRSGCRG